MGIIFVNTSVYRNSLVRRSKETFDKPELKRIKNLIVIHFYNDSLFPVKRQLLFIIKNEPYMKFFLLFPILKEFFEFAPGVISAFAGAFFAGIFTFATALIIHNKTKEFESQKYFTEMKRLDTVKKEEDKSQRKNEIHRRIHFIEARIVSTVQVYYRWNMYRLQNYEFSYLARSGTEGLDTCDKSKSKQDWLIEENLAFNSCNQYFIILIEDLKQIADEAYRLSDFCKNREKQTLIYDAVQKMMDCIYPNGISNSKDLSSLETFIKFNNEMDNLNNGHKDAMENSIKGLVAVLLEIFERK